MSIAGPFVTNRPWPAYPTDAYYQAKYKWVGPAGTRPPMPYGVMKCKSDDVWATLSCINLSDASLQHAGSLSGRAYDKFWNLMQSKASLGVSLLESKKSLDMITRRVKQLTGLVRAIRRLDIASIHRILGVSPTYRPSKSARVRDGKTFSNLWLEYTFGWTPLIGDIYAACKVLSQDFAFFKHKVRVYDLHPQSQPWDGGSSYATISDCFFTYGATVRVTNPNLNLANQLGLANPAYILWDAVPFSFVLDWFAPVGQFLRRLTNGLGLEITKAWKQASVRLRGRATTTTDGTDRVGHSLLGIRTVRSLGVLAPPDFLSRIKFPQLDPWLAATSLSLFVQQFKFGMGR